MATTPPNQARSRTPEEISRLARCPEVVASARHRRVTKVVHFTTMSGAVGILASGTVKSRRRLPRDKYLEHIYRPNALDRRGDAAWHDYVNMSVSRINDWMFDSSTRWHIHNGVSWVVFSFGIEILGDPGVVFTTTNNIYPCCLRAEGLAGFDQIFASSVLGRYAKVHTREGLPSSYPTDRQAEVLYPGELPLTYLMRIDAQVESALDDLEGAVSGLGLKIPLGLAPEVFQ